MLFETYCAYDSADRDITIENNIKQLMIFMYFFIYFNDPFKIVKNFPIVYITQNKFTIKKSKPAT